MFKHTTEDGRRNICGTKIMTMRKAMSPSVSQRELAEMVQRFGVDVDKTAIRRIENGQRYITDIEIKIFCKIFNVTADYLLDE